MRARIEDIDRLAEEGWAPVTDKEGHIKVELFGGGEIRGVVLIRTCGPIDGV